MTVVAFVPAPPEVVVIVVWDTCDLLPQEFDDKSSTVQLTAAEVRAALVESDDVDPVVLSLSPPAVDELLLLLPRC